MMNLSETLIIFLKDDGISLQTLDGQSAGYWPNGNLRIFAGQNRQAFPARIVLHDERSDISSNEK
ncbi:MULTISPECIES: hypothetical protein [Pantoea]|uniref:Uncharacterized protein n=1 Tax=Candidatus Pantoea gossypiicola TaxID=2608008 RepID=A0AB34CNN6_9GAMM|nr:MULTISPECIES: hypothetical protein [Pantoea]KAA5961009.1 hypothetical protein F3I55_00885 [Pantoea sp. VH_24]KAA5964452.1 hypothetical protein F3I53_01150 [Pantoea sp. VH_16]KAA5968611.1 hypothetical protein F3I54_01365 [Pantoea sp. VH_18]KAA6004321.1 hypothetical protein F3I46_00460 [Pantoea sp. M_1]KAA6006807.1 hypothetical protein F3I45_01125 [Pantoea sp. F_7]